MIRSHHDLTDAQFGPQAAAYVASTVHAQGADLERLASLSAAHPGMRVLDVGTGGGHAAYALAPHAAEVVVCDLSAEMVSAVETEARQRGLPNIIGHVAAAERLPFDVADFDLIVSRFSAHHWPDLVAGLREARRVLKPGGVAVFVDIVSPPAAVLDTHLQAIELLRDPSHARDYRTAEWGVALEQAGFAIVEVQSWRLHMDFAAWAARMNTSPEATSAIRSIQAKASAATHIHFEIEPDGSFQLDAAWLRAVAI